MLYRMSAVLLSALVACNGAPTDSAAPIGTPEAALPPPVAACPDTSLPPVLAKVGDKEFTSAMVDWGGAPPAPQPPHFF
jgi:hypothetical protein